jgi:primosomal protein N' (replication factor Y) (superfamily II helicase)
MLVRVAIDLALDRLFTYSVPEALEKKLAVGQLLSVPFGHRETRGFAMAVEEGDGELGFAVKPVSAIVDETPFFSRELLELVKRLSEYTAAPIESVLHAAVPAAVLKPGARAKELFFVEPAMAPAKVEMTKRQQWLYDQIVRLGGGWMQQLCRELKTTPASVKALGLKGLVTVASRQKRRDPLGNRRILPSKPLPLNEEQRSALSKIVGESPSETVEPRTANREQPVLLFGITGSGKTEVYLQAIARELGAGKGAIVMVPEIALTPQTVQRFASRFGDRVAVLHSALSDGERYDEWHRIRSGEAQVVVGPRSAIFAPVRNLGLIVVDEEHETSYKQEDNPRYHARDAAVMRGRIEGAKVVLGSATPSLESWANVARGKYALAPMARRAGSGTLPAVHVVDMGSPRAGGERTGAIFSRELLDAVKLRLNRGEQTILFLNRRGYSRSVACDRCGYVASCPDCCVPYTYHQADDCCRCHICGGWVPTPHACPECKSLSLTYKGIGTQRAEAALAKCFQEARILRMDADSTSRKNSHDDILGAFRRGEADVLLGTQMIAKGLDFPNVTLVGVLNADSSLNMPDFRAGERTYQLLSQVAGRAGRAELPGEVFIQTYDPSSPTILAAARGDFAAFAKDELAVRKELSFPPYCHLSLVNFRSKDQKLVANWATMYAESLKKVKGINVGDALPSALEKAEGWYRWQVVLRTPSAALAVKAWRWIASVRPAPKDLRVGLDVDAFNLM